MISRISSWRISDNIASLNRQYPLGMLLWGAEAVLLMLTAFEVFHAAFPSRIKEYGLLSRGLRGSLSDLGHILLAIGMTLASFAYQRASDPFCGGSLGAGFPAAFICDATGESPISDWGRMSWTDIPNLLGTFVDILFYAALLWAISFVAIRIIKQIRGALGPQ